MSIKSKTLAYALSAGVIVTISACAEISQNSNVATPTAIDPDEAAPPATPPIQQTSSLEADDGPSPSNNSGTEFAGALGGGMGSPISGPVPAGFTAPSNVDLGGTVAAPTVTIPGGSPSVSPSLFQ